jgi:hypothetical protein
MFYTRIVKYCQVLHAEPDKSSLHPHNLFNSKMHFNIILTFLDLWGYTGRIFIESERMFDTEVLHRVAEKSYKYVTLTN